MNKELVRFVFVGGLNTLHYFLWFVVFTDLLNLHYIPSHWIAFIISMIGSYFMNTLFTYQTKLSWKKFFQFPAVYVLQILISTVLIYFFTSYLGINEKLSSILASIGTIPFTFVLSKKILKEKASINV